MFGFKKLKQKLLFVFIAFSIIPLGILVTITLDHSSTALESAAYRQLESVREIKREQLDAYFASTISGLKFVREDAQMVQAIRTIDVAFTSAGNKIDDYDSRSMAQLNNGYFQAAVDTFGWYDLFFVNQDGYIIFSQGKESDLGQSLVTSELSKSSFGQVFAMAKSTGSSDFFISDFSPYSPSGGEPAAFIISPMTNPFTKKAIGYVALKIPLAEINELMQQREGMGATGETYLVGSDLRMRSDSFLDPKTHSVAASFAGTVKNNGVDTEATSSALSGETASREITSYNGKKVLSAFTSYQIGETQWALIAEIDSDEAYSTVSTLISFSLVVSVITIVIVSILGVFIANGISRPILAVSQSASLIAQGDLTIKVQVTQSDEVGALEESMHAMVTKLHAMVTHIGLSADQQASAAEELAAITSQTTTTVNRQQMATDQVASAITEMSASIAEVTQNTVEASKAAKTTSDQMNHSASVVTETVSEVKELEAQITNAVNLIQELEQGAADIGGILDVIKGIADQTNLLALNAAIEAARAGDQGRGFAVVADEVRSLAQNTQKSAGEIEDMIIKLQGGAHRSVTAMNSGAKQTDVIVSKISDLATVLEQSQKAVRQISDMSLQIATATEQQSSVSNEISDRANEISQLSAETGESTTQIATASDELARLAGELTDQVSKFRT